MVIHYKYEGYKAKREYRSDGEIWSVGVYFDSLTTSALKKRFNSLKDTGSKHSGQVEGSHTVFFMVALHKGEEVAEVAEEAVVDVRKLLEQVSHI